MGAGQPALMIKIEKHRSLKGRALFHLDLSSTLMEESASLHFPFDLDRSLTPMMITSGVNRQINPDLQGALDGGNFDFGSHGRG